MLTLIPRISHSFMFNFNTFLQNTSSSGRKLTLIAWISYSFMLRLNMSLKMTGFSSHIITFSIGKIVISFFSLSLLFLSLFWSEKSRSTSILTTSNEKFKKRIYKILTSSILNGLKFLIISENV